MQVTKWLTLAAVGAVTAVASQVQASLPPLLGLNEPQAKIIASNVDMSYNSSTGVFNISTGTGTVTQWPGNVPLASGFFNLSVTLNTTTHVPISGSLDVGDGGTTYFFSGGTPLFGGDGFGTFEFQFTQEDKPVTDTTFASLGSSIGVIALVNSEQDLSQTFRDKGLAKAFSAAVPEPVSTMLVGMSLGSLALWGSRRRAM